MLLVTRGSLPRSSDETAPASAEFQVTKKPAQVSAVTAYSSNRDPVSVVHSSCIKGTSAEMILTCSQPTSRVNDHDGSVRTCVHPAIACRETAVVRKHDKELCEVHSNFAKQQWVRLTRYV